MIKLYKVVTVNVGFFYKKKIFEIKIYFYLKKKFCFSRKGYYEATALGYPGDTVVDAG